MHTDSIIIALLVAIFTAEVFALNSNAGMRLSRCPKVHRIVHTRNPSIRVDLKAKSEVDRYAADPIDATLDLPPVVQTLNKMAVCGVKGVLELMYKDRPYAKFAALETIARVPYFSYTSVLHLYETFGWFRKKEYIQIHFAESWNELHHLLIMEELGGTKEFWDRCVAQYIAFFYYWVVVVLYMVSPAIAYDLNKQVEVHAYKTYLAFLNANEVKLKALPAPQVAKDYYQTGDLYMFDAFQYNLAFKKDQTGSEETGTESNDGTGADITGNRAIGTESPPIAPIPPHIAQISTSNGKIMSRHAPLRRPIVENLYDVFSNICADEAEHADTMSIMQRDACLRKPGKS